MAPMPAGRDSRGGRTELNVTLVRRAEKLGFREKQGIQVSTSTAFVVGVLTLHGKYVFHVQYSI